MKNYSRLNLITCALSLSVGCGWTAQVGAETVIDRDTEIDSSSPNGEDYLLTRGATLTLNGATTGSLVTRNEVADYGRLITNAGTRVEGNIRMYSNRVGMSVTGTHITGNAETGGDGSVFRDSVIDGNLGVYGGSSSSPVKAQAENILSSSLTAQDATWEVSNSQISNESATRSAVTLLRGNATVTGSNVHGVNSAVIMIYATPLPVKGVRNYLSAASSRFTSVDGPVFQVGTTDYVGTGNPLWSNTDITLSDGSFAASESGQLLKVEYFSDATLNLDASRAEGRVSADSTSTASVNLRNGSVLSGSLANVSALSLDSTSVFIMDADSDAGRLSMGGGTVRFASQSGSFNTLTLGELTGGGSFFINADVAAQLADFLNVTGNADGSYILHVANSGAEPVGSNEQLQLVHTGGGDASFAINGGKVDVGTWEYRLVQSGNDWYLVQDGKIPEPGPDPEPEPGPGPEPERGTTTPSTDAVLNMASATQFMFYGELDSLRSHRAALRSGQHKSGVWGDFLHNADNVSGAHGSSYKLRQNGLQLGADTRHSTPAGVLVTGAFVASSDGKIKNARGGTSNVDSWGAGLYASLYTGNGFYLDVTVKGNRFASDLSTRMSDGTGVSGSWHQYGYGADAEAGWLISLPANVQLQPYARLSGYQTQSKSAGLSNGMQADLGRSKSLRGEAGISTGISLTPGSMTVTPYLTAALQQEFSDSNTVRINNEYNFENDFSGTRLKTGAGVRVDLTSAAQVFAEASYLKGSNIESPLSADVGVRIRF